MKMNPSTKFGLSTRRVRGGKRVPTASKPKRVQVILPAVIAKTFGVVK
jgi:hypothetical protein